MNFQFWLINRKTMTLPCPTTKHMTLAVCALVLISCVACAATHSDEASPFVIPPMALSEDQAILHNDEPPVMIRRSGDLEVATTESATTEDAGESTSTESATTEALDTDSPTTTAQSTETAAATEAPTVATESPTSAAGTDSPTATSTGVAATTLSTDSPTTIADATVSPTTTGPTSTESVLQTTTTAESATDESAVSTTSTMAASTETLAAVTTTENVSVTTGNLATEEQTTASTTLVLSSTTASTTTASTTTPTTASTTASTAASTAALTTATSPTSIGATSTLEAIVTPTSTTASEKTSSTIRTVTTATTASTTATTVTTATTATTATTLSFTAGPDVTTVSVRSSTPIASTGWPTDATSTEAILPTTNESSTTTPRATTFPATNEAATTLATTMPSSTAIMTTPFVSTTDNSAVSQNTSVASTPFIIAANSTAAASSHALRANETTSTVTSTPHNTSSAAPESKNETTASTPGAMSTPTTTGAVLNVTTTAKVNESIIFINVSTVSTATLSHESDTAKTTTTLNTSTTTPLPPPATTPAIAPTCRQTSDCVQNGTDSCAMTPVCVANVCKQVARPNGSWCDDGRADTRDSCVAGVCVGRSKCEKVECPAASTNGCLLHSFCNPLTGSCVLPPALDGSVCRAVDSTTTALLTNNTVLQPGICVAGACKITDLCLGVVCATTSVCVSAGVCDTQTGQCALAPRPDRTKCNDGNPFTFFDQCSAGECVGVDLCSLVQCDFVLPCVQPGVCSRGHCQYDLAPSGAACSDGREDTVRDQCSATGVCVGVDPCRGVVCDAVDQCLVASCAGGMCQTSLRENGTPCSDRYGGLTTNDVCRGGQCIGSFAPPSFSQKLPALVQVPYGSPWLFSTRATGHNLQFQWFHNNVSVEGAPDAFLAWREPLWATGTFRLDVTSSAAGAMPTLSSEIVVRVSLPSAHDNPPPAVVFITSKLTLGGVTSAADFAGTYQACLVQLLTTRMSGHAVVILTVVPTEVGVVVVLRVEAPVASEQVVSASLAAYASINLRADLVACVDARPARRGRSAGHARRALTDIGADAPVVIHFVDPCAGVTCNASDACHEVGVCVAGVCTDPAAADNSTCDDGQETTVADSCNSGQCIGTFLPVDCAVGAWQPWSLCRAAAPYNQTRTRAVVQPAAHGGLGCPALTEQAFCAPIHCALGEFGNWSACDPAYPYAQNRTRAILHAGQYGGLACAVADMTEEQGCAPVDCVVSEWAAVAGCSKPCGLGVQHESRTVSQLSALGGLECPALTRSVACNVFGCPTDCQWGNWTATSACSATCGLGSQHEERVVAVFAAYGGKDCSVNASASERVQPCHAGLCPGDFSTCALSSWLAGGCNASCGRTGVRINTRLVTSGNGSCPPNTTLADAVVCDGPACAKTLSFAIAVTTRFVDKTLLAWTLLDQTAALGNLAVSLNVDAARLAVTSVREGSVILEVAVSGFGSLGQAAAAQAVVNSGGVVFAASLGSFSAVASAPVTTPGVSAGMAGPVVAAIACGTVFSVLVLAAVTLFVVKRLNRKRTGTVTAIRIDQCQVDDADLDAKNAAAVDCQQYRLQQQHQQHGAGARDLERPF